MRFEWDPVKDQANQLKHGLSFLEASELLSSGEEFLEIYDEPHSLEEDRFIAVGLIRQGVIVVIYTERTEDITRILSARKATAKERSLFERYWQGRYEK